MNNDKQCRKTIVTIYGNISRITIAIDLTNTTNKGTKCLKKRKQKQKFSENQRVKLKLL